MSMIPIADRDTPQIAASDRTEGEGKDHASFVGLAIGSIGVVYGDIGTSPLYAFRESVTVAAGGGPITREIVLGVCSLILWALIIVVTIKYIIVLLRADNNGEGGSLSLMALASRVLKSGHGFVIAVSLAGAALFYGDSIITPAISVLSSIEGIKLIVPAAEEYVVPITVVILIGLFAIQRGGTAAVAQYFGPVMLAWFLVLAVLGISNIADDTGILYSFDPLHGLMLFLKNPLLGLIILGAVFLCVTGAESLYADLGHFGRGPIQLAWFAVVFPALTLNYLGQGALLLSRPEAIENPFFLLAPEWGLIPLVALATIATVTASQAVITGAYSVSRQAVQLGMLPRMEVRFTSATHRGQIYVPKVNMLLLVGVLVLVLVFRTSSDLASAYGISVTGTMVTTDLLAFIVIWKVWGWSRWTALLLMVPFTIIDLVFLGANMLKLLDGGWVPLLLAAVLMLMMATWRKGTRILSLKTRRTEVPLGALMHQLEKSAPHQVPGTAVYLTSDPDFAPSSMLHSLKHFRVLHEHIVILTIVTATVPRVDPNNRIKITKVSDRFTQVSMMFGYMETPNVPQALGLSRRLGWTFDIMKTSFFLSRRIIKASPKSGMPMWQDHLFIAMAGHADDATRYFHIPTGRVVEIGTQVTV